MRRLRQSLHGRTRLVVTTPSVHALYGPLLLEAAQGLITPDDVLVLDCDETRKSIEQVEKVCARALPTLGRDGVIVGFGGGVVLDIVCFAASMIRRGIGYIKIPTTLVGQVDAGIGVKGGVNFGGKKSYLGSFYAPEQVLIDPAFLATLGSQHLASGVAEIIKMAVISDALLFAEVERMGARLVDPDTMANSDSCGDISIRAINLMLSALAPNLTERSGYERSVDFGHTFSPALEAALSFQIPHGFCVAVDMALSAAIAVEQGHMDRREYSRLVATLAAVGLPVWHGHLTRALCRKALVDAAAHRGGALNLVLPTTLGTSIFVKSADDITDDVLDAALGLLARDHVRLAGAERVPRVFALNEAFTHG
jgi:3-dehydroquinate synthase